MLGCLVGAKQALGREHPDTTNPADRFDAAGVLGPG